MTMRLLLSGGEGFTPPGVKDFDLPAIFDQVQWLTKPVLLVALSVILISVYFIGVFITLCLSIPVTWFVFIFKLGDKLLDKL